MLDVDQSTLISWDEFVARFEQVIWEHNYQRRHSGIGNKIPFDAYRRNLQPVQLTDEEVASMMLVTGRSDGLRKVHPDGIHFRNRYYAGAAIGHLIETEVQVRAWHQCTDRIAVYVDDTFVALIGESIGLDADQRRLIMEHRIADERAVRRGFRTGVSTYNADCLPERAVSHHASARLMELVRHTAEILEAGHRRDTVPFMRDQDERTTMPASASLHANPLGFTEYR